MLPNSSTSGNDVGKVDKVEIRINPAIHKFSKTPSGNKPTWTRVENTSISPGVPYPPEPVSIGPDGKRHDGQKDIPPFETDPEAKYPFPYIDPNLCFRCYEVDPEAKKVVSIDDELVFQNHIYLFNIIVAVEWMPSLRTLQELRLAAQRASNFLFDVTDGYMAIGQVLIGGREIMEVADIQLMASNRLHPRSWVAALHYRRKFQPIRVGRGLWSKNHNFVITWDEPTGYRALVHEWGHYALGLTDDYLSQVGVAFSSTTQRTWEIADRQDDSGLSIVVPNIGIAVESIMSTLEASELIPQGEGTRIKRREGVFKRIQLYFPHVEPGGDIREGPAALPIDAPIFPQSLNSMSRKDMELPINSSLPSQLQLKVDSPSNCWAYVLKPGAAAADPPAYIIAQGTFLAQLNGDSATPTPDVAQTNGAAPASETPPARPDSDTFRLLGADAGDSVVLMRQVGGKLCVVSAELTLVDGQNPSIPDNGWRDVAPDPEDLPLFVDVLPEPLDPAEGEQQTSDSPPWLASVSVHIETRGKKPDEAYLYFYGQKDRNATDPAVVLRREDFNSDVQRWRSQPMPSQALDGHVLLRWNGSKSSDDRLLICSFSQSGGPGTSGGGYLPITAGSADGNVMVFFRKNIQPLRYSNESGGSDSSAASAASQADLKGDLYVRIVTTTMIWGRQRLLSGADARSYVFSVASNASLREYPATLVFYFDKDAPKRGGDLLVHRWRDDAGWQSLTTYIPADQQYVGVPLDREVPEAAGRLIEDDQQPNGAGKPRFERYRVYWTP